MMKKLEDYNESELMIELESRGFNFLADITDYEFEQEANERGYCLNSIYNADDQELIDEIESRGYKLLVGGNNIDFDLFKLYQSFLLDSRDEFIKTMRHFFSRTISFT